MKFTKPVYFLHARLQHADFSGSEFQQQASFSGAQFHQAKFFKTKFQQADFLGAEFDEVNFIEINFPNNYIVKGENNKLHINRDIPVIFDYSTFKGRVRLIGSVNVYF